MKTLTPTLLAALCALALSGAAAAEEPDPKAEPAESHHGGGDAMQHDRTAHPLDGPEPHDHDDPGDHGHDGMHDKGMHACRMPSTGDADQDFALRMRHHHHMGVEMSRRQLTAGDDAEMRALAQAIINAQTAEIARIDTWLAANGVNPDKFATDCGRPHPHPHHGPYAFEQVDTDGDGFIEHGELVDTDPMHQHFAMADLNADGKLDRAEIDAHHAAMARGDVAPRLTSAPHPPMPPGAGEFAALDANHDGYLTLSELAATEMLHQHFAVADADKDGRLTPAEVDAHHAFMHSQMKH